MARIRLLLLIICTMVAGHAAAQPFGSSRCNMDRIREEFASRGQVPSLRGCLPDDVRLMLQSYDYGLEIENHVSSRSIREGRIVSQRVQSSMVYVDLSTGPAQDSEATIRQREEEARRERELAGQIFETFRRVVESSQSQNQRPPVAEPSPERPRPPPDRLVEVMTVPPRGEQATPPPTNVAPTPPLAQREPVPTAPAPTAEVFIAPTPAQTPPPPMTDSAPEPTTSQIPEIGVALPVADLPPDRPVVVQTPPVFRIFFRGSPSAREGEELQLVIRREGGDGLAHRLRLGYNNPALLVSPPLTYEFGAGPDDEIAIPLRTAVSEDYNHHDLVVTLANAGEARVGQPASVTAAIFDPTPWWRKLLRAVAALPAWIAALVVAAAAGGTTLFLMPRATCSIGRVRVDLGRRPIENRWPAVSADVVIGNPSYSVPIPLPIGRTRDAKPSSA